MGFFKKLFGGDGDAPAQASGPASGPASGQPSSAPVYLQRAQAVEWEWESPQARALTHEILTAAAAGFQPAQIKELPDDENIDLRGTFAGSPVRFAVWMSFGTFWAIEMMAKSSVDLTIERDHEKIPKTKAVDDPWSENEERRIFIGRGIFFEGSDHEIAERLAVWGQLPDELQGRILHDLEALDARTLTVMPDKIHFSQTPGFTDLPDPIGYMHGCAALMATVRDYFSQLAPQAPVAHGGGHGHAAPGGGAQLTCAYCSSLFVLRVSTNTCPNCGAPAQG